MPTSGFGAPSRGEACAASRNFDAFEFLLVPHPAVGARPIGGEGGERGAGREALARVASAIRIRGSARPSCPSRRLRRTEVDALEIPAGQLEHARIHHAEPERRHVREQEHQRVAARQRGQLVELTQRLVAARRVRVMVGVPLEVERDQVRDDVVAVPRVVRLGALPDGRRCSRATCRGGPASCSPTRASASARWRGGSATRTRRASAAPAGAGSASRRRRCERGSASGAERRRPFPERRQVLLPDLGDARVE